METFVFSPRNDDTIDLWSEQIKTMYLPKKPVRMIVDLNNFNSFDIKKMVGLKCVLDAYRPVTRVYLHETLIKTNDPVLKNFIKSCLFFFKPERPVRFI
jgi:hypothetical protein